MYDANGKLTRDGAISVVQSGGSVNIGGRVYTTLASLPDEATFAAGDAAREAAAHDSLTRQIADLEAQRARLAPVVPTEDTPRSTTPGGRK